MSTGPQATFVVEYPCDQFCRIEVDLVGEPGHLALQQMWERADGMHRGVHEPEMTEATTPDQEESQRPATTLFRSAPSRSDDRRSAPRARPRR